MPLLLGLGIFAAIIALTIRYAQSERFFYFWDNFAYHRATLESLGALQNPQTSWWGHLRISMQSGFSQLFTVTLAPLMAAFGETRSVFIGGIVGFYLLPCTILGTLIVNRITPLQRGQWPLVFAACASLPVLWRASLSGYPDIGGLAIAMGGILVLTIDFEYKRWRTALTMGVILAVVFLFRRHLVYSIVALMAAASSVSLLHCLCRGEPRPGQQLLATLLRLATTTVVTVFLIWLVAPNYFQELISNDFRELYLPYQATIHDAAAQHRDYIGLLYWLLGVLGLGTGLAQGGKARWISGLLGAYLLFSSCIWIFYLRYLGVQYNLHFAVVVAVGIGLLTAYLFQRLGGWRGAIALNIVLATLWLDRLAYLSVVPRIADWALPAKIPPLQNPDYDEIKRLIDHLHTHAGAPRNNILVAASSQTMNSDMLTIGEKSLYGSRQARLAIMNGSHVDTVQPYSLRDMIAADLILVATPFQHHLRVEDQGVVRAISDAMLEPTAFARDFRKTGQQFSLTKGVELTLYERIAPTPFLTQVEAARRMFDTVGMADAWTGPFMIGEAATGAEYYDVRLIVPQSAGRFTIDLSQVRMKAEQAAITLFVRTAAAGSRHLRGDIRGVGLEVTAKLFPDQNPTEHVWEQTLSCPDGADLALVYPSVDQGILALTLVPKTKPAPGVPLGLLIDNLRISEN
jgi:hypothetical protein